jgi:hypothetical protein
MNPKFHRHISPICGKNQLATIDKINSKNRQLIPSVRKRLLLVILVAAVTAIVALTFGMPTIYPPENAQFPSYGQVYVTGIQVHGNDLQGDSINWGRLYPGSQKNVTLYVRSISNVPITLTLTVTDWAPKDLGSYLHLYWNYTCEQIAPNQEICLNFTLTVPSSEEFEDYLINNLVSSFSFNLHISSTGSS